jgi:hypothetical protein
MSCPTTRSCTWLDHLTGHGEVQHRRRRAHRPSRRTLSRSGRRTTCACTPCCTCPGARAPTSAFSIKFPAAVLAVVFTADALPSVRVPVTLLLPPPAPAIALNSHGPFHLLGGVAQGRVGGQDTASSCHDTSS